MNKKDVPRLFALALLGLAVAALLGSATRLWSAPDWTASGAARTPQVQAANDDVVSNNPVAMPMP